MLDIVRDRDRRNRPEDFLVERSHTWCHVCEDCRLVEVARALDHLPAGANAQARLTPIYETLEGWQESTHGARSWAELPANAIKYVRRVEELIGAPVALLSTSPDRDDTIMVRDPFI